MALAAEAAAAPPAGDALADAADALALWEGARTALALLAVNPHGLGGLHVRAGAGPVRDRLLADLAGLLPEDAPLRRCPAQVTADRLLGGLDLSATLRQSRPVLETGVLAAVDGGVLLLAMAERLSREAAGIVADVMDRRAVRVERDGLAALQPARFAVLALDEGGPGEAGLLPVLADRLGLVVRLDGVRPALVADDDPAEHDRAEILAARRRLPSVTVPEEILSALVATAAAFGIASLRAPLLALETARAAAALAGREAADADDARLAAGLVLAPRATRLPAPSDGEAAPDEADGQPGEEDAPEEGARDGEGADPPPEGEPAPPEAEREERPAPPEEGPLEDLLVEAVRAAVPAELAAAIAAAAERAARGAATAGHAGADADSGTRGRPAGVRRASPRRGLRLSLVDTLRAAAPFQPMRRAARADVGEEVLHARLLGEGPPETVRVDVRPEDFRVKRFKSPRETLTVFAVDASGSSARARLAEAKGTVERLLGQAYARRDHVALVAFRGAGAEVLLPPTRSLARAKRCLRALPGGGGTPVAAGLSAAARLADDARRKGQTPTLVVLTDGRANVAADGGQGRARAREDALKAARRIRADGLKAILIDVSPRKETAAADLAAAMGGVYLPLPRADSARIAGAVEAIRRDRAGQA